MKKKVNPNEGEQLKLHRFSEKLSSLFLYSWTIVETIVNLLTIWSLASLEYHSHKTLIIILVIIERVVQVVHFAYFPTQQLLLSSPPPLSVPSTSPPPQVDKYHKLLMRAFFLEMFFIFKAQKSTRNACYLQSLRVHNIFASVSSCFALIVHLHALVLSNTSNLLLTLAISMHVISLSFSNTTWYIQSIETRSFVKLLAKNFTCVLAVFPFWALTAANILPSKFLVIHLALVIVFCTLLYLAVFHFHAESRKSTRLPSRQSSNKESKTNITNKEETILPKSLPKQTKQQTISTLYPLPTTLREASHIQASSNQLLQPISAAVVKDDTLSPLNIQPLTPSRLPSSSFAFNNNNMTVHAELYSDNHLDEKHESNDPSSSAYRASHGIVSEEVNTAVITDIRVLIKEEDECKQKNCDETGVEASAFHEGLYHHWSMMFLRLLVSSAFLNVSYNEDASFMREGKERNSSVCAFKVLNIIFLMVFDFSFNDTSHEQLALRTIATISASCYILSEISYITHFQFQRTVFYEGYILFCQIYYEKFRGGGGGGEQTKQHLHPNTQLQLPQKVDIQHTFA